MEQGGPLDSLGKHHRNHCTEQKVSYISSRCVWGCCLREENWGCMQWPDQRGDQNGWTIFQRQRGQIAGPNKCSGRPDAAVDWIRPLLTAWRWTGGKDTPHDWARQRSQRTWCRSTVNNPVKTAEDRCVAKKRYYGA